MDWRYQNIELKVFIFILHCSLCLTNTFTIRFVKWGFAQAWNHRARQEITHLTSLPLASFAVLDVGNEHPKLPFLHCGDIGNINMVIQANQVTLLFLRFIFTTNMNNPVVIVIRLTGWSYDNRGAESFSEPYLIACIVLGRNYLNDLQSIPFIQCVTFVRPSIFQSSCQKLI